MDKELFLSISNLTKPCITWRSNSDSGEYPKDNGKITALKNYLKSVPLLSETPSAIIYGMTKTPALIISSHMDTVPSMHRFYCLYDKVTGIIHGNLDNAAGDGVLAYMAKYYFNENVWYAFTADEETGHCKGVENVFNEYKKMNTDKGTYAMALDCTYEDFDSFTIENISLPEKVQDMIFSTLYQYDKTFRTVYPSYGRKSSVLRPSDISKETALFDEAAAWAKYKASGLIKGTCSVCLPVTGSMHSDSGCFVKDTTLDAYVNGVLSMQEIFTGVLS